MAGLTSQELLQPSLLDRLTDDAPDKSVEPRDQRVFSVDRLRASVLRDLVWLLNTGSLSQTHDLSPYPHVANSVLNYGVPDLAGSLLSTTDLTRLERQIRQSILDFEPRILADTVKVTARINEENEDHHNSLVLQIEGDLWSQPLPLQLYISTVVDLEDGSINVDHTVR